MIPASYLFKDLYAQNWLEDRPERALVRPSAGRPGPADLIKRIAAALTILPPPGRDRSPSSGRRA